MSDILIVDDERDIRELIGDILEDEGFATRLAGNSQEAMNEINAEPPALLILDIWLKDSKMDGIDILKTVKRDNPDIPVVIISGHGNIEIAVAAIKQGAYDFIEKPFNIDQLLVVIRRAMETSILRRENVQLKRGEVKSAEMIGESAAFRALLGQLEKVTKSNGRGGQGSGRALYPCPVEPGQGALRHGQLRRRGTRDDGGDALWPRNRQARDRAGPSGAGAWRGGLFR